MKRWIVLCFVVLVGLALCEGATKAKKCDIVCGTDYTPVCASDGANKPRSFGNMCVLNRHNCEQGSNLRKISDGECPGGGGVRLS